MTTIIITLLILVATMLFVMYDSNMKQYVLFGYVTLVAVIFLLRTTNTLEYLSDSEAIQNLASLYSTGNMTVTNLTVTGDLKSSGTLTASGNLIASGPKQTLGNVVFDHKVGDRTDISHKNSAGDQTKYNIAILNDCNMELNTPHYLAIRTKNDPKATGVIYKTDGGIMGLDTHLPGMAFTQYDGTVSTEFMKLARNPDRINAKVPLVGGQYPVRTDTIGWDDGTGIKVTDIVANSKILSDATIGTGCIVDVAYINPTKTMLNTNRMFCQREPSLTAAGAEDKNKILCNWISTEHKNVPLTNSTSTHYDWWKPIPT